jgi:4-hydroxy-4-methyl-2-oxoglutarate aldolase
MRLDHPRPSDEELGALSAFSTATLHEAMGRRGAMPVFMKPIYPGMRVCGAALTVDCPAGDNLMIHAAIECAAPGDVLVVDFKGFEEAGPFGDVMATASQAKGIRGIVIDGCVRDGATLREMGFPAFARGLNMKGTSKRLFGSVGEAIICAGVAIAPGDAVIGDDDGVVVVPRGAIGATLEATRQREDKEAELRERLRAGATTVDLLGLRETLSLIR